VFSIFSGGRVGKCIISGLMNRVSCVCLLSYVVLSSPFGHKVVKLWATKARWSIFDASQVGYLVGQCQVKL
jgi:hypothetical protein